MFALQPDVAVVYISARQITLIFALMYTHIAQCVRIRHWNFCGENVRTTLMGHTAISITLYVNSIYPVNN